MASENNTIKNIAIEQYQLAIKLYRQTISNGDDYTEEKIMDLLWKELIPDKTSDVDVSLYPLFEDRLKYRPTFIGFVGIDDEKVAFSYDAQIIQNNISKISTLFNSEKSITTDLETLEDLWAKATIHDRTVNSQYLVIKALNEYITNDAYKYEDLKALLNTQLEEMA
jgi:hypothetical protein